MLKRKPEHYRPGALLVILFTVTCMLQASVAHAYIDPGTGSYLFQLLIGGALGGMVALKLYWKDIVNFFRKRDSSDDTENDENEQDSS